jgi:hypothetical protein
MCGGVLTTLAQRLIIILRVIITRERLSLKEDVMKKVLLIISILALVTLPIGCTDIQSTIKNAIEDMITEATSTYTIKVSSNMTGLNVTGKYTWVIGAYDPEAWVTFSSDSEEVTEQLPVAGYKTYTVEGVTVAAMFQKQTEENALLKVEILEGTRLVDSAQTTDPWGAVFVSAIGED